MYLSFTANQIRLVESVLRDHNMYPTEVKFPVLGGNQLINIRDDQLAKDVIFRLKANNVPVTITSTA